MKKSFWTFLILAVLIMILIFCFSQQNAEESTKTSKVIVEKIVNEKTYDASCGKSIEKVKEDTEFKIRKSAHFCLYYLLGLFVFMTLFYSDKLHKNYVLFIFSMIICILYATSDEVHQLFMDGRSGQVTDVLLDSGGSLSGCITAFIIQKIRKKEIFFIKTSR